MQIKYLGHSSFLLIGKEKSVVTDPFGDIGYEMQKVKANYCLSSHNHYDHNCTDNVICDHIIKEPNNVFLGIDSFHDKKQGKLRGKNLIFKFTLDGITFCHMGDVGEFCTDSLVEEIGEVDVLFIPIGGNYTINSVEAISYIKAIKPKIAIPMHFKTEKSNIDIDGIESFLKLVPFCVKCDGDLIIEKESLPTFTTIVIPFYKNF